jgi:5-bromo-4-chloroindolyl phosphate hydrolysis protein
MKQDYFKNKGFGDLLSGLVGGMAFLIFFLLGLHFIIAIVIAIAAFIGTSLLFSTPKTNLEIREIDGFTPEMITKIIGEGEEQLKEIYAYSERIQNKTVKMKITELCELMHKIFENIRKDPKGIKTARKFLSYYLEATGKIVKQYVELSETEFKTPEIVSTLQKAENLLTLIKSAFEKQMTKLLEDDVLDLDTEISLLEKTIQSEGL